MTNFDEKDRSLLRCTLKKSASTVIAIGKIAICIVAIVLGIAIASGAFAVLYGPARSLLVAIPWWAYAIGGGAGLIILHSFLWCIAREVTPEAYADTRVNEVISKLTIALLTDCLAIPFVVGMIAGIMSMNSSIVLGSILGSFAAVLCLFVACVGEAWDDSEHLGKVNDNPSILYKFYRFLPAYYYMTTDSRPLGIPCDPPYSKSDPATGTDDEQTK